MHTDRRVPARALAGLSLVLLGGAAGFAPAARPTMPVSEIRAGMRGYGLSVFRGTEPERFDVEVIDVLSNFRPDQDLVLIKTPHPLLDRAGSVAGMSGSPIYLDDRLIGAYAYGWAFGKDPIAGVTPIVNMLRELDRPLLAPGSPGGPPLPSAPHADEEKRGRYRPPVRRDPLEGLAELARTRAPTESGFRPAATPLLVGGMPAKVAGLLRERFQPLGLEVLEAAGGGTKESARSPTRYVDGGSMAVTLLRGDVQATAVGTVTHVDGRRAIAFGHPMLDAGELALPTATSRVLHVMASERSSFKIAEALAPLGALVHDRQSAVVVDAGTRAPTIPIDIQLAGVAAMPRTHWRVEAASHRLLTPPLVMTALASALGASLNDAAEMMYRVESIVTLKKHGAQRVVDEGFSALGVGQPLALSRLRLFDLLAVALDNPFERATVERIDVKMSMRFGRDVTEILGAQLARDELDPGEPARVVVTLRALEGPVEQRLIEVPLEDTLAGEQLELVIGSGDQVSFEQPLPTNLADVLRSVKSGLPSTTLAVSIGRKGRGLSLSGHVVRNLPGSALDALATARDTKRSASFVTERHLAFPLGRVVVGQTKLALSVRKQAREENR